jgi:hypothetical protein
VGDSVGSDVGEGVEAEDHVRVNGRSGEGFELSDFRGLGPTGCNYSHVHSFSSVLSNRQKLPRGTKNVCGCGH